MEAGKPTPQNRGGVEAKCCTQVFSFFPPGKGKATQRKPSTENPGFKSPIFPLRVQTSPERRRIYGAAEVRCNVPPAASVPLARRLAVLLSETNSVTVR